MVYSRPVQPQMESDIETSSDQIRYYDLSYHVMFSPTVNMENRVQG